MATTTSPGSRSDRPPEGPLHACLGAIIDNGYYLGKAPLFVLGAGISAKRVPFIDEMAGRLVTAIRNSTTIPKAVKAILIKHGDLIQAHRHLEATRQSFSQHADPEQTMPTIWQTVLRELALDGLPTSDGRRFTGLFRLYHSQTPMNCATVIRPIEGTSRNRKSDTVGAGHVLNLNYDPLLFLAMSHLRRSSTLQTFERCQRITISSPYIQTMIFALITHLQSGISAICDQCQGRHFLCTLCQ